MHAAVDISALFEDGEGKLFMKNNPTMTMQYFEPFFEEKQFTTVLASNEVQYVLSTLDLTWTRQSRLLGLPL